MSRSGVMTVEMGGNCLYTSPPTSPQTQTADQSNNSENNIHERWAVPATDVPSPSPG